MGSSPQAPRHPNLVDGMLAEIAPQVDESVSFAVDVARLVDVNHRDLDGAVVTAAEQVCGREVEDSGTPEFVVASALFGSAFRRTVRTGLARGIDKDDPLEREAKPE